jgi:hypothetical protein
LLTQLEEVVRYLAAVGVARAQLKSVRSISGLIDYCRTNGLRFGPVLDGEEASYTELN